MRFKKRSALTVAVLAVGLAAPMPAKALGWFDRFEPRGWGHERAVRHYVYLPRYRHKYYQHGVTDPYAYRYEPNGYYPYYNSRYWRPRQKVRRRQHYRIPPYYKAWGDKKRGYNHKRWHYEHHGGHRRWDW